ncbi:hypothetical protein PYW07_005152 [Mythimna separata]|uniref:Uncharacterized protein n=1 Tax=Mythimna separata TaxID=271217 RepID=A0AAD8DNH4_MYTSE|nr:hypothetical protein PYW07_005152 [Mythimna separata]
MSALGNENQVTKQLQQDLQNELNTTNQLLRLISVELQQIKHLTRPSGEFEANIVKNTSLIKELGKMQQVDLDNLPPFTRRQIDIHTNQHASNKEDVSYRIDSLEESQ